MRNRTCIFSIAMLAISMTAAAAATHPAIGSWELNLAKSTDESANPPPKSQTFIFTESAKGISLSTRIVGADGKLIEDKGTPVKWDGVAHPETRGGDHDSITVKQVGAQTVEWAMTKKRRSGEEWNAHGLARRQDDDHLGRKYWAEWR